MDTAVDTVTLKGCPTALFPALDDAIGAVQVIIEHVETDGASFAVATNLGADLPVEPTARAVGMVLHRLSHALMGGASIDLSAPANGGTS